MLLAVALAAASALMGGALALAARRRRTLLELTRTFAFAAAAGVVAFHLLPELLPSMGASALIWIALGFALPWLLELGARSLGPGLLRARGLTGPRVAAEVGFAALVFHSVVEGLALVAALQAPEGRADLEIALVAHHAPLTAAVALPFLELLGARAALVRVLVIAAAGVTGVLGSAFFPRLQTDTAVLQLATAVTAGALLHVVADEIRQQRFSSRWERAGDILACLAGLGVAGFGAVLHLRSNPAATVGFLRALLALVLAAAPGLVAGLLVRPWTRLPIDAVLIALLLLGPAAAAALLMLLAISPRGGAAPEDEPADSGLRAAPLAGAGDAGRAGATAADLAGADFADLAGARAVDLSGARPAALAGAYPGDLAGALEAHPGLPGHGLTKEFNARDDAGRESAGSGRGASGAAAGVATLLQRWALSPLRRRAPWLLAALVGAASVDALAPASLPREPWVVALLLTVLLAARIDVAGAALIAAVLVGKGVPAGLAVALVAGGALLHLAPIRFARMGVAGAAAACIAVAVVAGRWGFPVSSSPLAGAALPVVAQLQARPAQAIAAFLLAMLLAATVWGSGVRGWFAPFRHRG